MSWIIIVLVAMIFYAIGYGVRASNVPKTTEIQPECIHTWRNLNGYTEGGIIRTVTVIQQCENCGKIRTQTVLG